MSIFPILTSYTIEQKQLTESDFELNLDKELK